MFNPTSYLIMIITVLLGVGPVTAATNEPITPSSAPPPPPSQLAQTLSVLTHLELGAIIPTLSMLNFPQATLLSVLLVPPILICSPPASTAVPPPAPKSDFVPPKTFKTSSPRPSSDPRSSRKLLTWLVLAMSSPVGVASVLSWVMGAGVVREGIRVLVLDWELLANWTWIGIWLVWWPIWAQMAVGALMS